MCADLTLVLEQVISCEIHLKFFREVQFSAQSWIVLPGSQNIIQSMDSVLMLKKNLNLLVYLCYSSVGFFTGQLDGHQ